MNKKPKKSTAKDKSQPRATLVKKVSAGRKGRLLKGVVVSDKMDKTIIVSVSRIKKHPKYKKRYQVNKKYKVDDAKNEYKIGDKVIIKESRPISKDKKWRVNKKL